MKFLIFLTVFFISGCGIIYYPSKSDSQKNDLHYDFGDDPVLFLEKNTTFGDLDELIKKIEKDIETKDRCKLYYDK